MRMIRSRLISLVLTLAVGLGLATSAFAHRLPTPDDLQMQALRAMGLAQASICGVAGSGQAPSPCTDQSCGLCASGGPAALAIFALVRPADLRGARLAAWPDTGTVPLPIRTRKPPGQAPPLPL